MPRRALEQVAMHGRVFTLRIEGPDEAHRYSAIIVEPATGRTLTRSAVRGRNADDARDRAHEVIRNLVTIERLQAAVVAAAADLAPGGVVEISEDAGTIRAEVSGAWILTPPLALPRDEITDPDADLEAWVRYVRDYLAAYLKPTRGS